MEARTCPLAQHRLVEEYFIEHRNKVLDIAAFLDRMDRSVEHDAGDDFRIVAFRRALRELCSGEPMRIERIQMLLSDNDVAPLETRDRQAAFGASGREG